MDCQLNHHHDLPQQRRHRYLYCAGSRFHGYELLRMDDAGYGFYHGANNRHNGPSQWHDPGHSGHWNANPDDPLRHERLAYPELHALRSRHPVGQPDSYQRPGRYRKRMESQCDGVSSHRALPLCRCAAASGGTEQPGNAPSHWLRWNFQCSHAASHTLGWYHLPERRHRREQSVLVRLQRHNFLENGPPHGVADVWPDCGNEHYSPHEWLSWRLGVVTRGRQLSVVRHPSRIHCYWHHFHTRQVRPHHPRLDVCREPWPLVWVRLLWCILCRRGRDSIRH
ncbi:hypothetical protein GQ53DRAFT_693455 [Thozetella sp. PMI_491]|nr:hypothetical protein GQ53DRAFT_693455 [Thozetella sp. PMI_491]